MSDFFGKLKSGAGKVAFEAEKMGRLNRAKGELERIKEQIQAQYSKLGQMYYNDRSTTGVTGAAYDEACQAIADLQKQVEAKNTEIQQINAENYAPPGAQTAPAQAQGPSAPAAMPESTPAAAAPVPAAAKFCPNCGREVQPGVKFCPDCGTKLAEA